MSADAQEEEWIKDPAEPRPQPRTAHADDVEREILKNIVAEGEIKHRWLEEIRKTFKRANWFVLTCILVLAVADNLLIAYGVSEPQHRVVTANGVMALIAATVAQVGAIAVAVWKSWYPPSDVVKKAPRVSAKRKPSA